MRILFTNNTLARHGGTEVATLEIASRMSLLGHRPVVFSQLHGEVSKELNSRGIPVISDLTRLNEPPDIIHGHHHMETMMACLAFPDVPAIYVCHGWLPWEELPPNFPTIMSYIGVGDITRERIVTTVKLNGRPARIVPTFFDDDRFKPKEAISPKPRSALIFNNALRPQDPLVKAIETACRERSILVSAIGNNFQQSVRDPQLVLPRFDIVFAVGRSALEAMACNCAVIACDASGLAGMMLPGDAQTGHKNKLGLKARIPQKITPEDIGAQIDLYDPQNIHALGEEVRRKRTLSHAVESFTHIYEEALERFAATPRADPSVLLHSASEYIRSLSAALKGVSIRTGSTAQSKSRKSSASKRKKR
jgi:glycosyltransferase involved in cell wall biosynthesis